MVLMAAVCVLFSVAFVLISVNGGKHPAAADPKLIYEGIYVDLLSYEHQKDPCDSDEMRVLVIDTETGYPAAASYTVLDKNGKEAARINTVRFNYKGAPAMLRFTDDVADGFTYGLTYQTNISDFLNAGDLTYMWKTDPAILQEALSDYSSQVSAILS